MSTIVLADEKYGSLAVDRSNGFNFGWSYDYSTQSTANNRAMFECIRRSKKDNCRIVLELSGDNKCGAYRAIEGEADTSYGWGKASTQQLADNIAHTECRQRSNGEYCGNQVWACNSVGSSESKKSQEPDISAIKSAVLKYYNNKSTWAGKFKIDRLEKIRIEGSGSNIIAHARYKYVPLPGNSRKSGYDQRIFYIQKHNGGYSVNRMDEYMSGHF